MNKNNKNNINWEEWERENEKEYEATKLKNIKSGSISYLEEQGEHANRKEIFHAHWETYLTSSDYWKNWREKINSFENEKEINFYTDRLRAFIEFTEQYTCKDKNNYSGTNFGDGLRQWDPETTPKLIEQELKRLENISEEEFNKTDKWRKNGLVFKELSTEEMLSDPWFNKQIDKFFGLGENQTPPQTCAFCSKIIDPLQCVWTDKKYFCNSDCMHGRKKDDNNSIYYKTWTKDQLISEINRLKAEIESLKNNQTLTSSERQKSLRQNQQKLEQLNAMIGSDNRNIQSPEQNNFPTSLVIGGGVLVIATLTAFLVIKNKKKQ
jgi:hypothetical protein